MKRHPALTLCIVIVTTFVLSFLMGKQYQKDIIKPDTEKIYTEEEYRKAVDKAWSDGYNTEHKDIISLYPAPTPNAEYYSSANTNYDDYETGYEDGYADGYSDGYSDSGTSGNLEEIASYRSKVEKCIRSEDYDMALFYLDKMYDYLY